MAQSLITRPSNRAITGLQSSDAAGDAITDRRIWTRDEYYRMVEQGILAPDEKTELIEGEIYRKLSPMRAPHSVVVHRVARILTAIFEPAFYVQSQVPATFSEISEPEPDVYVARGFEEDYEERHPGPSDIVLAVEVSDKTLHIDRSRKATLYADYGIEEYWIVNLVDRQLEVFREPENGRYKSIVPYNETATISPLAVPNHVIEVRHIFPAVKQQ